MASATEIVRELLATRLDRPDGSKGETIGNILAWIDQHAAQLVVEQLGPKADAIRGPVLNPPGWEQLGGRTQVEALAALLEAAGLVPRAGK